MEGCFSSDWELVAAIRDGLVVVDQDQGFLSDNFPEQRPSVQLCLSAALSCFGIRQLSALIVTNCHYANSALVLTDRSQWSWTAEQPWHCAH